MTNIGIILIDGDKIEKKGCNRFLKVIDELEPMCTPNEVQELELMRRQVKELLEVLGDREFMIYRKEIIDEYRSTEKSAEKIR